MKVFILSKKTEKGLFYFNGYFASKESAENYKSTLEDSYLWTVEEHNKIIKRKESKMKKMKEMFNLPTSKMLSKRKVKNKNIDDIEFVLGRIKGEFISSETPEAFCDWLWNSYLKDTKSVFLVMDGREIKKEYFPELFKQAVNLTKENTRYEM